MLIRFSFHTSQNPNRKYFKRADLLSKEREEYLKKSTVKIEGLENPIEKQSSGKITKFICVILNLIKFTLTPNNALLSNPTSLV